MREGYRQLQLEFELARRRLVIAKAERVDTRQLELEFAAKLRELDALAGRRRRDDRDRRVAERGDHPLARRAVAARPHRERGTMSRWLEDLGMSVGATVVAAMHADAVAHAFCIATD
ncbi:MAG TPA: hypothetical protein VGG74_36240 [Kofleriaceae bacterium]